MDRDERWIYAFFALAMPWAFAWIWVGLWIGAFFLCLLIGVFVPIVGTVAICTRESERAHRRRLDMMREMFQGGEGAPVR